MRSGNGVAVGILGAFLVLGVAFVQTPHLGGRQEQSEPNEDEFIREMQRRFAAIHCTEQVPEAVEAFAGCWKVAAVWGDPTDEELKLGMRMTGTRAQLLINSHQTQQVVDSSSPRYCVLDGQPTVAPYPDADFSSEFSYAYVLIDIPLTQIEESAEERLAELDEAERAKAMQNLQAMKAFAQRGGKMVISFVVFGPDAILIDADGEEDFWALPTTCDGWDEVEKHINEQINDPKGFRSFRGRMRPPKQ
jgi:hypothetical protein